MREAPLRILGALLVGLALAGAGPAAARGLHYLHVRANEGGSSGGHVAVRFDDLTYHFQHDGGLLRIQRDSWTRFEHLYRTLQNRGISASRIETSDATWELLRRAFQRRYLTQERELARLASLRRDARLARAFARRARGEADPGVVVRGAGFFRPVDGESPADARALDAVRRRLAVASGPDFVAARRAALEAELAALRPDRPAEVPFADRHAELRSALAALDVLQLPHALRRDRLVADEPGPTLRAPARARLRELADALASSLARLVSSPRPDWGHPLLLGLARLAALERSLEDGRLRLLDALPADAERLALSPRRRQVLPPLLAEARADRTEAWRRVLAGEGFREADWSGLETAASRLAELRRARDGAAGLRVQRGALLPEGAARRRLGPAPADAAGLTRWLAAATDRERRYAAALRARHGYHLILRNCVSEVFRTIEGALAPSGADDAARRRASHEHLGGYVAPLAGLNFIPFVSARRVAERYAVAERLELPSYRHYQLERMRANEPDLRVALRESNVFTSTLYTPGEGDGSFVFFTDRTLLLRPVLGAVNLAGGLLASGAGLLRAPFDRGRTLRSGLSGVLFSLPELGFVNLRKGSNEYVPLALRPPLTPSVSSRRVHGGGNPATSRDRRS